MSVEQEDSAETANDVRYPSPGAEAMDAGPFYHTGGRDQEHDQPDHHPAEELPDHGQPKDQNHSDMHHTDPIAPHHQHATRPPNLEELQLAAQLGNGLAGTSMMPATDPNMSTDPNMNNDPNMNTDPNMNPDPNMNADPNMNTDPGMNMDDHGLRNMMPPPDEQHTPYLQDTPTSDSMVSHGLVIGPNLPPHYGLGDSIPPRKRSKVSRACDECRRKKIKCDAQSDNGETPCSSCARSSTRCLFSRVPQKRGPSKGYIKELADRIHSIENKLESEGGLTHEDLSGLFGTDRPRNTNSGSDSNKKRPYSSISGGDFDSPSSGRQAPWGAESRSIPTSLPSENNVGLHYSAESLAPHTSGVQSDVTSKQSEPPLDIPLPDVEIPELTEGMLQDYLATVHTLYPILPSNKQRLDQLLDSCPTSIRIAFVHALLAVVQSSSGMVKLASSLLNEWESGDSPRTTEVNIVHAQTLLLLIIDADWRCSPTVSSLLARAVALANTMGLWRHPNMELVSEVDSDDNLSVRIWWSLVIMDRWHAVGTGRPVLISMRSVVPPAGLETVLTDVCFYLARLSRVLNRVSDVIVALKPTSPTVESLNAGVLTDLIEIFREDLPARIEPASHPLVHLSYWHCRLLTILLTPGATATELTWPLRELIELLSRNSDLRSPLANHFTSAIIFASAKLINIDSCRDEATQLSRDILEKQGVVWDVFRDKLSDQVRLATLGDAAGLQRLADLATSHQSVVTGTEDQGIGPSLSQGYLQLS